MWFVTQPKERDERPGLRACPRPRQLRDLLDLAAQAAAGHGAARPRPPCRRDRGRRNLCGRPEEGKRGREVESKAIVAVAAEQRGRGIGRIRLRRVKDVSAESLSAFLRSRGAGRQFTPTAGEATPGCRPPAIRHQVTVISSGSEPAHEVMPRVHKVAALAFGMYVAQETWVGMAQNRTPLPGDMRMRS